MNELSIKVGRFYSVSGVTDDWVADSCQMHSDLMCAPCQRTDFEQGVVIHVFSDLIPRAGLFSRFDYCHPSFVMRIPPDRCFDDSLLRRQASFDKDKVSFVYGAALELCHQVFPGEVILGNHYEPRRIFVQSVDYSRACEVVVHRQAGAVGQEGID